MDIDEVQHSIQCPKDQNIPEIQKAIMQTKGIIDL